MEILNQNNLNNNAKDTYNNRTLKKYLCVNLLGHRWRVRQDKVKLWKRIGKCENFLRNWLNEILGGSMVFLASIMIYLLMIMYQ